MPAKTNVTINGIDYYQISQMIDGKRKWFRGSSKGDAERQRREYLRKIDAEKQAEKEEYYNTLFRDRANQYISSALRVSQAYSKGTRDHYESTYHLHIENTWLAKMKLSDIKAADIQRFYNELDVSSSVIKSINKFLTGFYKWATKNEYAHNVLSAVEMPQKPENKQSDGIVVWESDEIKKITAAIEGHRLSFLVYVLLYTGARISEALALKYSDIKDDTISINKQYYKGEMTAPKYNSSRNIPMNDVLLDEFKKHKAFHEKEMRENGYKTEYIFTTNTGKLCDRSNIRKSLNRVYEKNNIPCKKTHAYRATFCTALLRNKTPLEVAANLMGHKDPKVTAKHYALIKDDTKRDAINNISFN